MEIEVLVKRTLVFAGLVGSVVAVVSLVAFVSQDVLARFVQVPRWLSNVFAAAIIAAVYGPLRNWLVNTTDRYLFQKKYDYKELLRKFADDVMVMVDLKQLVQKTVNTLADTVKLEGCSLLLLNKDHRTYELAASRGVNGQSLTLEEQEPFITFLRETHEPIGQDGKVRFPEAVTNRLKQLNARLCLPLHLHEDMIGVLCLGKKKSDEEFAKDDLDILQPLARSLAIAVSNAQLFEELAKTQAEAAQKEKLAVIGTLSAGINHEICNPLGIVKAQCEAFLLDVEDGILVGRSTPELLDRTSNIMRTALKQIDRATAITQKLSNFAKPIKEPTAQPVSVAAEIDEVLLLVGHDLKLEKIEVIKEVQPDLAPILVDRRQLQEVLFNLVRNAGQAITPPGKITIRASERDAQVRIEIEDTGSGIPADKLQKIYDPFFTTKEPGKGTGLGLFIVRQIVERNKGRIAVESAVGKGTTFSLDFQAARTAAAAAR
jgi:signal transduction histidine kinase